MESNNTNQMESTCKMRSPQGYCPRPLEAASSFLSKKWTISMIITIGNFSKLRFSELERRIDGITAKILTERLKELAAEGIVERTALGGIPPRVEYSLTPKGESLQKSLAPLIKWAGRQN